MISIHLISSPKQPAYFRDGNTTEMVKVKFFKVPKIMVNVITGSNVVKFVGHEILQSRSLRSVAILSGILETRLSCCGRCVCDVFCSRCSA